MDSVHECVTHRTPRHAQDGILLLPPGEYWLVVWTVVDQSWGKPGQGEPAGIGPQSFLSNARTNPQWESRVRLPDSGGAGSDGGDGGSRASKSRTQRKVCVCCRDT